MRRWFVSPWHYNENLMNSSRRYREERSKEEAARLSGNKRKGNYEEEHSKLRTKKHSSKSRVYSKETKPDLDSDGLKIVNKVDPIMLGSFKKHTFKFARTKDIGVLFNVDSLVDWCLSTGDFSDPETRIPFSDEDLKEIDRTVGSEKLYYLVLHLL